MTLTVNKIAKDPSKEEINLVLKLFNSKQLNEAKKAIENKFKKYPNSSILFNILGAVFSEEKLLDQAIKNYNSAIKNNPKYAQAHNNLGTALHKLNKINEAIDSYNKAITININFAEAFNNLGNARKELSQYSEAKACFKKAIKIKPNYFYAFNNLGSTYLELGKKEEALSCFQEAVKIKPDFAEVYNHLGMVFSDLLKFDQSLINYNKAIKLKPNDEKFYNNLGNLFNNLGEYDKATEEYRKAIKIKPDYAKAYSNLLFNLNYKTDFDSSMYLLEAKKFRLNCKSIKKKFNLKHQHEPNPKKLKIGFISADFGSHPGGYFTLSTLRELRKKNFDLVAYSTTNRKDEISKEFKPLFLKWHLVEKSSDEELVKKIFKEGIHILIDLQGHSANNRLPIFMYKPAPIQATWLGQGSTGIEEIDYFIGSKHITPKEEDNNYVEKIYRLPEISQVFTRPDFDIKTNTLPAIKNNFITFGCANKLSKVNNNVISLWSKILLSIPNSKLILKNKDLDDNQTRKNILNSFKKYNIQEERLLLKGQSKTRKELLSVYNEIDIALDPFPFQGNTSTIEAVWMGVPVITLKGDRYLFHFGESINSNLNMKDWIAENQKEYISKAIKFSQDIDALSKIRINLRKNAEQSPVFDASRFAEHFSQMLWYMWKNFRN